MGFSLPFLKKKKSPSLYFGLYITDASLFGFLFDTTTNTPVIISHANLSLSSGFDKILEDTDTLISEIELNSGKHIDKTIFFLHSWMIDEASYEIKAPFKDIIKKLAKDLELDPMGYIDVQEALHEYLQKSSILNTVALEVNKTKLGISAYKGGKKVFSQYTARTDSVGEDLQSVVQSIPGSIVLPTKILVFGDIDSSEVASELVSFEWDLKTFTQHPTIEVLKQQELNDALACTFAEEVVSQSKVPPPTESAPVVQDSEELKDAPQEDFGFMVGKDIADEKTPPPAVPLMTEEVIEPPTTEPSEKGKRNIGFFRSFKLPSFSFTGSKKKPVIMGIILAIIAFVLVLLYEYFFHTMNVTVYLNSQELTDEFDLTLPVAEGPTSELAVIKRTTVQEFEDEKRTTGTREDGEKATGDIVIHNYTKEPRTFARGTELRKGDLIFSIDSEVKVASASGGTVDQPSLDPGKVTVKATASEIGPDYNIGKGSELSVASLSDTFKAFADTAFTGGSKKEVKTVSRVDRDTLAKKVEDQADEGSAQVLGAAVSDEDVFLPDLTTVSISETEFSGEIGEEATSLTVKAQSEIEFYTIEKQKLKEEIAKLLSEDLPEGLSVDVASLEVSLEDAEADDDEVKVALEAQGKALKEVDEEAVTRASAFKLSGSAVSQLQSAFDVAEVRIERSFSLSPWTPLFRKNISVTTVSQ